MASEGGNELAAQLTYGFRLCTSRQPKAAEFARLISLYEQQRDLYRKDEKAARQLAKASEMSNAADLAARIIVANVLLNLDETLTKE